MRRPLSKSEDHVVLVDIAVADFQSVGFGSVCEEAKTAIEGAGGGLRSGNRQEDLFERWVLLRALSDGFDQFAGHSAAAEIRVDIDAEQLAFVEFFEAGSSHECSDSDESTGFECARREGIGRGFAEALRDCVDRCGDMLFGGFAEGFGFAGESLKAQVPPGLGVGFFEDSDVHRYQPV